MLDYADPLALAGKDAIVILKEFTLDCVAHTSYLVADLESGVAAVVDPQPDVDPYLEECWRLGVEVRHVFLTQHHSDFMPGHLALRDRACAHLYLGAWAKAPFPFTPLKNGDVLEFGKVRLEIVEVPGHALEGIAILFYDLAQDGRRPRGIFTGDTVLVGDVGRPRPRPQDGLSAVELAGMLHDPLRERILALPDSTRICPAHGSAAICGIDPSGDYTLGVQRRHNFAFQPANRREFVRRLTAGMVREAPAGAGAGGPLRAASLSEVLRVRGNGIRIVDFRDPADFAGAHLEGSLNVPLASAFESWAGTVIGPEEPVVIVADPGCEEEAVRRLARIGIDQVSGCLRGGMMACEARPDMVRKAPRLTLPALAERQESSDRPFVLDVRDDGRKAAGADLAIPLEELWGRADEVPEGPLVVVQDAYPFRSSAGASLLRGRGRERVADLAGGRAAWKSSR